MDFLHFDLNDEKERLCALTEFTGKGWQPREVEDFFTLEQMDRHDHAGLIDKVRHARLSELRSKYASTFRAASAAA